MTSMSHETTEVLMSSNEIYKPSAKILKQAKVQNYKKVVKQAKRRPLKFWEQAANELEWYQPWKKVLDDSKKPFYKWFTGAKTNIVLNALDRHMGTEIENKVAIISEQEVGKRNRG